MFASRDNINQLDRPLVNNLLNISWSFIQCDAIRWEHFFAEMSSWPALSWYIVMQTAFDQKYEKQIFWDSNYEDFEF